ncbi:TlpA family protein disulfide reductase [Facklamia hominis]|uniref:TlpA family protein disulfide reductase n=1 Tax=Facklamia hominis TaxID=178214 RepID=UPI00288916ED|nr:redoxin family protein [Facklamia hominis]WPJ91360.1 redoxin family protein [Facklamia hominis]
MNKRLMYLGLSLVALLLIAGGFYRHYQNEDSSESLTNSQPTSTSKTALDTTKTTEASKETSKAAETTKTTERASSNKTTSTSKEDSSTKETSEDDEDESMSKAEFLASIEPKNFRFTDQEGEMVDFEKASKGKPAVVNIWATWCNPCRQEMPEFQKVWEDYQEDVNFYLVNALDSKPTETKEKVEQFLEELNFKMPIYYDYHLKTMAVANAVFFPTTLFIDAEGQVVHYQFGQMDQAAIEEQLQQLLND